MICTNNRTYEYEFGRSNHWTTRALALVKSELYYTSRVYYTSVLGAERKRKARERLRSFHSCGGAETISGGYSFIHNDWDVGNEQSGENESRSSLVSARSFSPGEKSRTTSGTRVARCNLQRALYSPRPLQEEDSFRHGFYWLYWLPKLFILTPKILNL